MKRITAILLLLLLVLAVAACGGEPPIPSETTGGEESTTAPRTDETTADPSVTVIPEGEMVYYEDFDSYGEILSSSDALAALRKNGVWRLDDKSDPYYQSSPSYTAKSTCTYALRDGKLAICGLTTVDGKAIASPADTYLVVVDEDTLWGLEGEDYTIRYDVTYASYENLRRYVAVVWNYFGQHYNSFHLRVNGTGNLQTHKAGAWLDLDRYSPVTDLYSPATDGSDGSSIANKLLGIHLGGDGSQEIFRDVTVTVVVRVSEDGGVTVWLSTDGGETLVKVSRYDEKSEIGENLNEHLRLCNGGALAIKTGAGINGTIDNLMVYTGHGDVPSDKTVTFDKGDAPEIDYTVKFTQERSLSGDFYSTYADFNASAAPVCVVPGLKQRIVPQGMDVLEKQKLLFITGYFADTKTAPSSMLFTVSLETGKLVGYYQLRNVDGSYHDSHVGGVAVTDRNVYIANGSSLYRIPLSAVVGAGDSGTVSIVEEITVPVRASFASASEGYLFVGDFYIKGNATYETPASRHLTDSSGAQYGAWCVAYRLTDETESGLSEKAWTSGMEFATPSYVLAIPQKIQGFALVGDTFVLSQSYGRTNDSSLLFYRNETGGMADTTVSLNGRRVDVWFLDKGASLGSYQAPPMSEGVASYGGYAYVLFESGSPYYKDNGGKNPTDRVWRLELPD